MPGLGHCTSPKNIRADRRGWGDGAPNAEHAVDGECAASGHGCEGGPQCEREVGWLAAQYDLDEGELLLAADRWCGGRAAQQVKAGGSGQRLPDLCDRRWPRPPASVGAPELHCRVLRAAVAHEVSDFPHSQHRALLTGLQVPGGCENRDGIAAVSEPHLRLLMQLGQQGMGEWRRWRRPRLCRSELWRSRRACRAYQPQQYGQHGEVCNGTGISHLSHQPIWRLITRAGFRPPFSGRWHLFGGTATYHARPPCLAHPVSSPRRWNRASER